MLLMLWTLLKPFLKKAAIALIQEEVPKACAEVQTLVKTQGGPAVEAGIRRLQEKLVTSLGGMRLLPESIKDQAAAFVKQEADALVADVEAAEGDPTAICRAFDLAQNVLVQKIQNL